MRKLLFSVVLLAGCCASNYPGEAYVNADEETYKYAQPKLEQWAEQKKKDGDPEWEGIVKNKGIAWKARIDRYKKKAEEKSE